VLQVEHLTKNYGPFRAVDDISFSARTGEILGFLGPNGAGKTTTMRMITGYLPPTAGDVSIDGIRLRERPLDAKRRVGYLPELPPVYPEFTVSDYLNFVAQLKQIPAASRKAAVGRALERAALTQVRRRIIGHLSKGYRQRVGIAQAILGEPPLLILDEPTAGLDPRQIIETRQLVRSLAGEHTIIISTHILSEAQNTCQRVIIINQGRLVAVDTPENLTHRLRAGETLTVVVRGDLQVALALVGRVAGVTGVEQAESRDGVHRLKVETGSEDVREALARAIVNSGLGLLELHPLELSLEQIFLSLTDTALASPPAGSEGTKAPGPGAGENTAGPPA
jgi:ABC-2 type transport system ATP-binding protein